MTRTTQKQGLRILAALATVAVLAVPAYAHHSFAMFDQKKSLTLTGTVRVFQWTNPHCFIQLVVPEDGNAREWSIEMHSPGDLYRKGWRPATLQAGDRVSVTFNPMRVGTNGGAFVSAIRDTGEPIPATKPRP